MVVVVVVVAVRAFALSEGCTVCLRRTGALSPPCTLPHPSLLLLLLLVLVLVLVVVVVVVVVVVLVR